MDKTSVKILKYLKKRNRPVSADEISQKFGSIGEQSLSHLDSIRYISQGFRYGGITRNPVTGRAETCDVPDGQYKLEPPGRDFLEHKFWNDFDRWITRATAFIGFVTGVLSLILHLIG